MCIIKIQCFSHQTKNIVTWTNNKLVNMPTFLTLQRTINALLHIHHSMAQEKFLIQSVTIESLSHNFWWGFWTNRVDSSLMPIHIIFWKNSLYDYRLIAVALNRGTYFWLSILCKKNNEIIPTLITVENKDTRKQFQRNS